MHHLKRFRPTSQQPNLSLIIPITPSLLLATSSIYTFTFNQMNSVEHWRILGLFYWTKPFVEISFVTLNNYRDSTWHYLSGIFIVKFLGFSCWTGAWRHCVLCRINEDELHRFYIDANCDLPCLLSSVKKTILWRKTFYVLSGQELEMWSNMVFWHGVDVNCRPCLIIRLGLAVSSLSSHERPRFLQAIGMSF